MSPRSGLSPVLECAYVYNAEWNWPDGNTRFTYIMCRLPKETINKYRSPLFLGVAGKSNREGFTTKPKPEAVIFLKKS